jgi:exopolysaccharide biosynthesis polyprenyl glycosylphosphotransferase
MVHDDGSLHRRARQSPSTRISKLAIAAGDMTAVAVATSLALLFKVRYATLDPTPLSSYLLLCALALPIWPIAFGSRRLYQARFTGRRTEELRRIIDGCAIAVVAIIVLDFGLKIEMSRSWAFQVGVLSALFVIGFREVVRIVFRSRRRRGIGLRRVVIVGDNDEALGIEDMLRSDPSIGYQVAGRVVQRSSGERAEIRELLIGDTLRAVADSGAHGVIIAVTAVDPRVSNHLVRALSYAGVHLELSSALSDISSDRLSMRPMGRYPVVYIEPVNRFGWRPVAKRAFDVTASSIMLMILAPFGLAIAAAVKLTSPGPVFFSQERVGRDGRPFRIHKFRTMVPDAEQLLIDLRDHNEADGPLFKLKDDPRVTRIGRVLRKTSIDEFPQIWNVLKGEMSLVGPRPALASETEGWSSDLFDRLRVRPGMTGMWQVSGRSESSFDEYTRLDLYYVDNWSILVDMTILAKTLPAVLAKRGAA